MAANGTRAAILVAIAALVLQFGEDLSVAALAAPILVVAGAIAVVLALAELRAYRRWSLR